MVLACCAISIGTRTTSRVSRHRLYFLPQTSLHLTRHSRSLLSLCRPSLLLHAIEKHCANSHAPTCPAISRPPLGNYQYRLSARVILPHQPPISVYGSLNYRLWNRVSSHCIMHMVLRWGYDLLFYLHLSHRVHTVNSRLHGYHSPYKNAIESIHSFFVFIVHNPVLFICIYPSLTRLIYCA